MSILFLVCWILSQVSKLESRDQQSLARQAEGSCRIDISESGDRLTLRISNLGSGRIGRNWIRGLSTVEYVRELNSHREVEFVSDEIELPRETQVLRGTALVSVIAVVRRGRAECTWTRLGPRGRIQNESR